MPPALRKHLPWLLGFLLSANLYLIPSLALSPRATDAVAALLAIWALRRLAAGRLPAGLLAVLALVNVMPLVWILLAILTPDPPTLAQSARWLLAAPWALALSLLVTDEDHRRGLARGLVAGGWVNVAVIALQMAGFEGALRWFGLSSRDAVYYHVVYNVVRIPGLHGHHAASSAVISLMVPASLYLYFRGHTGLFGPLASLGAFLVASHWTSTRSPLVVTVVSVGYAFVVARQFGRGLVLGLLAVAVVVPAILVLGPPGGRSRWEDALAVQVNARERTDSNAAAVELALAHPGGLGVTRTREALYDLSGITATHNAYLQAAVIVGLPQALVVLGAVAFVSLRGLRGPRRADMLAALLAFHCAGLFLFEEHLNNPTFVILTSWFVAACVTPQSRLGDHQRQATGAATAA